jgi:pimeloyl-ACP methyl ester carboxylesterase
MENGLDIVMPMALAFGGMELDLAQFELRRAGAPVPLEPQVFDVLVYLVQHRDRVVAKEELMDQIWGGRFVSETAVTSRIKQARRAIGDDGQSQSMIKTSHGRGYRFVAAVTETGQAPVVASNQPGSRPPPVRYTTSDGLSIAFQVTGSGPQDIVLVTGFVSHLELDWGNVQHDRFLNRLAGMGRLIRFDKRGTGMSDRPPGVPDLETRMHDVLAVMDEAGSERAALVGYSEGGPMAVLFAATHPERVSKLVLIASYAKRTWAPDYPMAQRMEDRAAYTDHLIQTWDWEADMRMRTPSADPDMMRWWAVRARAAATPSTVRALMDMNALVDVREVLSSVRVPTLVVHRTGDTVVGVENGRYVADHIPHARFVELSGADHFVSGAPDQLLDPIEDFLTAVPSPPHSALALAAVVGVTGPATEPVLSQLAASGGRVRPTSPGRRVVLFDGPATAVRAALPAVTAAAAGGSLVIAEVSRDDPVLTGFAIETAVALSAMAPLGTIWTTTTGRDLLAGSGVDLEPAGTHQVGPAGRQELYAVVG